MQCLLSPEDVYDKDKDDYGQVLREGGGSGAEGQPEGQDPHLTGGLGRLCRGQVLQVKKFPRTFVTLKHTEDKQVSLFITVTSLRGQKISIFYLLIYSFLTLVQPRLVNDPAARAKFTSGAKSFLQSHGFDGMLLEWHFPVCWHSDCSKGSHTHSKPILYTIEK